MLPGLYCRHSWGHGEELDSLSVGRRQWYRSLRTLSTALIFVFTLIDRPYFTGAGMGFVIHLPDMRIRHMGIYLCSGDGRMAKQLLYRPEIGAITQEMGSEAMPQRMRRDLFDPCLTGIGLYN